MDNFINDPLGAMSKGLSSANQKIKANAQYAAESIKNNENLKESLKSAKDSASYRLQQAKETSYIAAGKLKENAGTLYEKNYHGQLASGIKETYNNAANKAYEYKMQYKKSGEYDYDVDPSSEMLEQQRRPYRTYGGDSDEDEETDDMKHQQQPTQTRTASGSGNGFPMNLSQMNNPLAPGYNPLASQSTAQPSRKSQGGQQQQIADQMNPLSNNPLAMGANPLGGPAGVQANQKMVELKELPTEFKNEYLERLGTSRGFKQEISKFEQKRIKLHNKAVDLLEILNVDEIDPQKLQIMFFTGVPNQQVKGVRPLIWRLVLGSLPYHTNQWTTKLEENYQTYEDFKKELIVKPKLKDEEAAKERQKQIMDHPLSTAQTSVWNTFFKDQEIWDEIEKDVKRTRSELGYFQQALDQTRNVTLEDKARLMMQSETKKTDLKADDLAKYIEQHADVLHRILFIYAKLNPGVKYIQGMNEVLAVLYYCFVENDFTDDPEGQECIIPSMYHESDLFFSFSNIMVELRDGFLRELDKEKNGIQGRIKQYSEIMKVVEPHAYHSIELNQVNHQFYSLRWFMLLLCQEFDIDNSVRLWDTLLADPKRFDFCNFVCVALVSFVRDDIIDGDFACCMENLQKSSDRVKDIRDLLDRANDVCYTFNKHEISYIGTKNTSIYLDLLKKHI